MSEKERSPFYVTREEWLNLVEELRKFKDETRRGLTNHDSRLDGLERWQGIQDERMARVVESLNEIKDDTRWIRRTFIAALVTGSFSGIVGMIVWLIQR